MMSRCVRFPVALAVVAALHALLLPPASAQAVRLEYRVVSAAPRDLQRVIDEAGRDGFACVAVARPDAGVTLPTVVVTLARPYSEITHVPPTVTNRIVLGSGTGGDLADLLNAGVDAGYRFCGVALAEVSPGPMLVAVLSPETDRPAEGRRYAAEVLGNRERVARLAARGREGFVPIAATPIADGRVPEQRNWLVVAERTAAQPVDLVVRSGPGPDSLAKAIAEQAQQGFICRLLWKQGLTPIVVVMSRPPADPVRRPEFEVETIDPERLDRRSGVYIGDVPYLSDGQRVVVAIKDRSSTMYTVADPLPPVGRRNDFQPLGDHLGRDRSRERARIVSSSVRRGAGDTLVLHTVLMEFGR